MSVSGCWTLQAVAVKLTAKTQVNRSQTGWRDPGNLRVFHKCNTDEYCLLLLGEICCKGV